jgi:2-keto-4-pentenoate hydratase/2-oxohepta-3-ene-1,7-dioic acid hydratase in catechol pathway
VRFVSFILQGMPGVGVLDDDMIAILPASMGDLRDIIVGGDAARAAIDAALAGGALRREKLSGIRLLPPLTRLARDVLCVGWNYWDHFEEGKGKREGQDVPKPEAPTFFTKGPGTLIGPYDDIGYDARVSSRWDYEAEVALVIGKGGRSIAVDDAPKHIWGYCLANDISQRDLQRRHGGQWLKGKSIDATMPIGPYLVTAEEVDAAQIRLQCRLNGQLMQDALVAQMAFAIPELIAELSFGMTLNAGDLVITGTPAGVGNSRDPPVFLKPGDEVVVSGTGLGELRNRVVVADLYGNSSVMDMRGRA